MTDIAGELDQLRIAVVEVEVLAALILESFDRADWRGADGLVVGRMGRVLGVLATSAMSAASKFERFQLVFVDPPPASAGDRRDHQKGTASSKQAAMSDRDAAIIKRDAEIVRRFRERCAVAFDCPTSYPFFRESYLAGEDSDAALLRIFKRNKWVFNRSDDDVISSIIEHGRWRG
jgi:hypothetical protein